MRHHETITCFGKGRSFESKVEKLLREAKRLSEGTMNYTVRPKIKLQNGETVIPDFRIRIELPHKRQQILLECQNRNRSSKSILHKIQHTRAKSNAHTFFFVYSRKIGNELARSLEAEGIEYCNLTELKAFLEGEVRHSRATSVQVYPLPAEHYDLRVRALSLNSHPDPQQMLENLLSTPSAPPEGEHPSTPGQTL